MPLHMWNAIWCSVVSPVGDTLILYVESVTDKKPGRDENCVAARTNTKRFLLQTTSPPFSDVLFF